MIAIARPGKTELIAGTWGPIGTAMVRRVVDPGDHVVAHVVAGVVAHAMPGAETAGERVSPRRRRALFLRRPRRPRGAGTPAVALADAGGGIDIVDTAAHAVDKAVTVFSIGDVAQIQQENTLAMPGPSRACSRKSVEPGGAHHHRHLGHAQRQTRRVCAPCRLEGCDLRAVDGARAPGRHGIIVDGAGICPGSVQSEAAKHRSVDTREDTPPG